MQKLSFLSPLFKNGKSREGKLSGRKGSTDYRKGSQDKGKKRNLNIFNSSSRHAEDMIVTPFAQILASLRSVRQNYLNLTHIPAGKDR